MIQNKILIEYPNLHNVKLKVLLKTKKINSKNPIEDANKIATEWNKFDSEIEKRRQNGKINKQKYEELKMLGKSQKLNQISRYDNDKQVQKLVSNLIKEYSKDYDVIYDAEFENYGLRKKT